MGARTLVSNSQTKRRGNPNADQLAANRWAAKKERHLAVVKQVVQDTPGSVSDAQVNGLARSLKRSKAVILQLIDEARETLAGAALDYVQMHKEAVEKAVANGDAKSLEVAIKGTQWAMSNLSLEGKRVIDARQVDGGGGPRILIGIKLGGLVQPASDAPALPPVEGVEVASESLS